MAFLWFLWAGHEGIPFWKWLVLENYVQKTVTLASASLRIIVAAQSCLATSMLASIIMETLGFSLKRSAFLSLQRSNGGLPFKLMEVRYFLRQAKLLSCLIALLSLTTLAAYLTSTALIADFEVVSIPGYPINPEISYSLGNMSLFAEEPNYSHYRPANFPVFAEYSELAPQNNGNEVDDTGPTVRAILPISSPSVRETLVNYNGYGTLLNSHVVCVKPRIENLTFESRQESGLQYFKPLISGSITLEEMPPGIMFDPDAVDFITEVPSYARRGPTELITFICQMASSSSMLADEWPVSMCVAGNRLNYTNAFLDSGRLNILGTRATSMLSESILFDPLSYVMVNYSGVPPQSNSNRTTFRIAGNNWTEITGGWPTWRTFQAPSIYTGFNTVSISYCFSHFAAIDTTFSANSSTLKTEPTLSKSNTSSTPLDARDVLRQLGADGIKRSHNDRGILSLQKSNDWIIYSGTTTTMALDGSYGFGMKRNHFTPPIYKPLDIGSFLADYTGPPLTETWGLCTNCMVGTTDDNTFGIHMALSSIFQTSIKASGSVATALQALFTVVNMMQYSDRLPQFDITVPTYYTQLEAAIQPRGRRGLTAVTIFLLLHIATIIAITVMFHSKTKNSFVGQNWHAAAQLQNENAIPVLEKAGLMRDNDVDKWMKEEGIDGDERFFMIGEIAEDTSVRRNSEVRTLRRRA
jgi:hypothetical protein